MFVCLLFALPVVGSYSVWHYRFMWMHRWVALRIRTTLSTRQRRMKHVRLIAYHLPDEEWLMNSLLYQIWRICPDENNIPLGITLTSFDCPQNSNMISTWDHFEFVFVSVKQGSNGQKKLLALSVITFCKCYKTWHRQNHIYEWRKK